MCLLLTEGRNDGCCYVDCKQNGAYVFQIVNLSFPGRKRATFNAKVAEFFVVNGRFVTAVLIYMHLYTGMTKNIVYPNPVIRKSVFSGNSANLSKINILRFIFSMPAIRNGLCTYVCCFLALFCVLKNRQ